MPWATGPGLSLHVPQGAFSSGQAQDSPRRQWILRLAQAVAAVAALLGSLGKDHDPIIEDAYKIQIRIDDEPANLDILDTAGQAKCTAMRDQYMRAGEGFIICFSSTDRRSFHEVREFKQLICRVRRTDSTPVLVGNKSDLKRLRQVTKEEGLALAREFSCPFLETSAAYRYYIDDVFPALVREICRKEKEAVLAMEKKI
ncbi:hypothetical protein MC885_018801 [Smutsia gigantea]|nr:hypothetical protein MC885_018801 [Smutsia gigantea]